MAHAGHGDLGYYVNPEVGFVFADDERGTDDGYSFGIAVGRPWTETRNLELDLTYTDLDGAEVYGLGLSLLSYLGESADRFYSVLRLGYASSDGHPNDDYDAVELGGGLGYRLPLMGFGDLRIEGTLEADLHSNEESSNFGEKLFFLDPTVTLGYQIPLGGQKRSVDRPDRDGVSVVDSAGDADDDGVGNDIDLCPDTPAGTPVDGTGCAPAVSPTVASDCPEPQADQAVDANGCAVVPSTLLATVQFEFDSAELTADAQATLDEVATGIAGGSGQIEVAGHASEEGDEYYNLDLSQRRASAVRRYLIDAGVSPARVVARGYGDDVPDSMDESREARRANRRVEVRAIK